MIEPGDSAGIVTQLFLSGLRGEPVRSVESVRAVVGHGLEGDRHAGKPAWARRQVLLVDARSLAELSLEPGALKENLVLECVALDALPPGQRLRLGPEVVLEISGPCVPCHKLEAVRPGLLTESWGRRGQLAFVLASGTVTRGDRVALLDVNPDAAPVVRPKLP